MADHKAPTSVTIASTEEETAFSAFIHKHWKTGLTVILAIGAGVMIRQYMQSKTVEKVDASWNRLAEAVSFEETTQLRAEVIRRFGFFRAPTQTI